MLFVQARIAAADVHVGLRQFRIDADAFVEMNDRVQNPPHLHQRKAGVVAVVGDFGIFVDGDDELIVRASKIAEFHQLQPLRVGRLRHDLVGLWNFVFFLFQEFDLVRDPPFVPLFVAFDAEILPRELDQRAVGHAHHGILLLAAGAQAVDQIRNGDVRVQRAEVLRRGFALGFVLGILERFDMRLDRQGLLFHRRLTLLLSLLSARSRVSSL